MERPLTTLCKKCEALHGFQALPSQKQSKTETQGQGPKGRLARFPQPLKRSQPQTTVPLAAKPDEKETPWCIIQ